MPVENIPWMIHGGKHSAASGRRVLFKATSGSEGVAGVSDCKVAQKPVADGNVIVGPGGGTMVSRYPGIRGESYDGQVLTDTVVPIAPNGGAATRYDMVIMRVDDWNFPGQQAVPAELPTDTVQVTKHAVIQGVAATAEYASDAVPGLAYPAIALARVAIPAGTSAITNAMITDLRKAAVPRTKRSVRTKAIASGSETLNETSGSGEQWPDAAIFTVECPSWATVAMVSMRWNGVRIPGGAAEGSLWVRIGHGDPAVVQSESTFWDAPAAGGVQRAAWESAAEVKIPAGLRGKRLTILPMARLSSGLSAARPIIDAGSSLVLDIEWVEDPAQDA